MSIKGLLSEFISKISTGELEIYNEASIQYELAIFLRQRLPNYKVQLERNISYFGLKRQKFEKREIDIVIYDAVLQDKHAIEIKYPTNGQGAITKPTGKKDHVIKLRKNYTVKWENINKKLKYWIAEI